MAQDDRRDLPMVEAQRAQVMTKTVGRSAGVEQDRLALLPSDHGHQGSEAVLRGRHLVDQRPIERAGWPLAGRRPFPEPGGRALIGHEYVDHVVHHGRDRDSVDGLQRDRLHGWPSAGSDAPAILQDKGLL
ncbi:MAG: hypothetical protein WKF78_08635 [Candidatus Limnocylindrales bacterium]